MDMKSNMVFCHLNFLIFILSKLTFSEVTLLKLVIWNPPTKGHGMNKSFRFLESEAVNRCQYKQNSI